MIDLSQPRPKPQYWQDPQMACKGFLRGNPVRKGDYLNLDGNIIQMLQPLEVETSHVVFATNQGYAFQFAINWPRQTCAT